MRLKWTVIVLGLSGALCGQTSGFTYAQCGDLAPSDFRAVTLFDLKSLQGDLREPVKIAFDMGENGVVDVYFVELRMVPKVEQTTARLRVYKGATKAVSTLLEIPVSALQNDGLSGLTLDPNFKQNGWIYLYYQIPKEFLNRDENSVFRLSRFTLKGETVDPASEAILHEIPAYVHKWHTAGAMQFDAYGDLWLAVGDNAKNAEPEYRARNGAGNTASLIGKILRIRPLPVPEGTTEFGQGITFTIPKGNFADFFAAKAEAENDAARAEKFRNPEVVRPEIYTMGNRNAYTMTLDPVRRWMTFGDCGPDKRTGKTEESTVVTKPGNMGWPFFAGKNVPLTWGYEKILDVWDEQDPSAPVNDAPTNTGLRILPPAVPATYGYPRDCAMTGPIYRYDPELASDIKMPPHFHRLWFITDYNKNWIDGIMLDDEGKEILLKERLTNTLFNGFPIQRPLDFQAGPDGAFYVLNYAGNYSTPLEAGLIRIEYTGDCRPTVPEFPALEKAGCTDPSYTEYDASIPAEFSNPRACQTPSRIISPAGIQQHIVKSSRAGENLKVDVTLESTYTVQLLNAAGHKVAFRQGFGKQTILFQEATQNGIYFLELTYQDQRLSKKVVVF